MLQYCDVPLQCGIVCCVLLVLQCYSIVLRNQTQCYSVTHIKLVNTVLQCYSVTILQSLIVWYGPLRCYSVTVWCYSSLQCGVVPYSVTVLQSGIAVLQYYSDAVPYSVTVL